MDDPEIEQSSVDEDEFIPQSIDLRLNNTKS